MAGYVFPAQAGMIPPQRANRLSGLSFPRASRDDPQTSEGDDLTLGFSPRKQG